MTLSKIGNIFTMNGNVINQKVLHLSETTHLRDIDAVIEIMEAIDGMLPNTDGIK